MTLEEMARCLTRLKLTLPQWAPKEVDRELCKIWQTVLRDFSDQQIIDAFVSAATNLTQWPAPSQIKKLCQGSNLSDEEAGQDIASRIEGAMGLYGYPRPIESEAYIGPLGWHVVQQLGGWYAVCSIESNDQLPSCRKQWRELGAIAHKNFHATGTNKPPALPEQKQNNYLLSALKLIREGA